MSFDVGMKLMKMIGPVWIHSHRCWLSAGWWWWMMVNHWMVIGCLILLWVSVGLMMVNDGYPPVIKHGDGKWIIYRWFSYTKTPVMEDLTLPCMITGGNVGLVLVNVGELLLMTASDCWSLSMVNEYINLWLIYG